VLRVDSSKKRVQTFSMKGQLPKRMGGEDAIIIDSQRGMLDGKREGGAENQRGDSENSWPRGPRLGQDIDEK